MPSERSLERTPTWAVASVCLVLVVISIAIEQLFHHLGSWLKKRKKVSLYEALQKITMELMLMGCISFILTVGQQPLSRLCVRREVAHSWHPCRVEEDGERDHDREYNDPCLERGLEQLVSTYGIHQFHIFIFMLAVAHIAYCVVTYGLGIMKMRRWRSWEDETKTLEYQYLNDPERFRFARDTSFGRRHLQSWSKSPAFLWIVSFFRQLFASVAKVDYLTLRHGFITAHLPPHSQASFDFNKYISKSLEEDFKTIVGISPGLWASALLFLLTNTHGWYAEYWLPFIPLIILLLVGTKLQVNITKMGTRILESGAVIKGAPVVQPGDDLFWFNSPKFMLSLIHLVLFQNAFQLAFLAWSVYEYQFPSCYHENVADIVIRITMGVVIQVLCSYVTLPLYALVTQMGSKLKPTIFGDGVATALRSWHKTAKKQMKNGNVSATTTPFSSRPTSPLDARMSPVYLLNGRKINYDEKSAHGGYIAYGQGTSASPRWNNMANTELRMDVKDSPGRDRSNPHQTEIGTLSFRTSRIQESEFGNTTNQDQRP